MAGAQRDCWSEWLLNRRFGGDAGQMQRTLEYLRPIRETILLHAALGEGETLLDVGCGDGFIGFGALEQSQTSRVIFTDISQDLLNATHTIAEQMAVLDRCEFIQTPAESLAAIREESVDAVSTRSVLIYVAAKQQAFNSFYRVLRTGGRLSIFEPINRFGYPEPAGTFAGFDARAVLEIAEKVKAVGLKAKPPNEDPMFNFDERDLIEFARRAGFREINLDLRIEVKPENLDMEWETWINVAPNPKMSTLEEAMREALSPDERDSFIGYFRPLVKGKQPMIKRSAVAYLWARR